MRFSKPLSLVSCSLLLIGVLAPLAVPQKKDSDKNDAQQKKRQGQG
jgi:hypothetical protein